MKRIYMIACGLLALFLLVFGCISLFDKDLIFSDAEQRTLATFPGVTFTGVMNGSFFRNLEEYYADTVPGREAMAEGKSIVHDLFDFSDVIPEETK